MKRTSLRLLLVTVAAMLLHAAPAAAELGAPLDASGSNTDAGVTLDDLGTDDLGSDLGTDDLTTAAADLVGADLTGLDLTSTGDGNLFQPPRDSGSCSIAGHRSPAGAPLVLGAALVAIAAGLTRRARRR